MSEVAYQEDPLIVVREWGASVRERASNIKVANLRGLGSVSSDERERMTLNIERAGDHWFLRISMQTAPRSEIFIWYILRKGGGGVECMGQRILPWLLTESRRGFWERKI